MNRWIAGVATAAALAVPGAVVAQVCVGNPALRPNSAGNVGMGASFFDGGKEYSAGATFGGRVFGAGSFTYTDFDDTTLSLKNVAAGVGFELAPEGSEVSVCPTVAVGYSFGLEILGIDVTNTSITPGLSAGVGVEVSPTVTMAPFARGLLIWNRAKADAGPIGEETSTDTSGAIVLGFGLIFNNRLSLGPSVYIPVGVDNGNTVFGVGLAVAVGGSR